MASVTGPAEALASFLDAAALPPEAEILGPVPVPSAEPGRPRRPTDAPVGESWERVLIRVVPGRGAALAGALKAAQAARTAKGGESRYGSGSIRRTSGELRGGRSCRGARSDGPAVRVRSAAAAEESPAGRAGSGERADSRGGRRGLVGREAAPGGR